MKQRCLFCLERNYTGKQRTTEQLEWRDPQTINWLVTNAPVFLGSLLYWNEPKATPKKSFPRSCLAYDSQPRHVQSNSQTLQSLAEKNADPDKPRKKEIKTVIIFYPFASVPQWNTAYPDMSRIQEASFWMQQKKQHWSQRFQLCLYSWHYLLTFFCFSSE